MADLAVIGASALAGWLVGVPLGHLTRRLCARGRVDDERDGAATEPGPPPGRAAGPRAALVPDGPLQAFQAALFAALAVRFGPSAQLVLAALLALPLVVVLFVDLRTRYVYSVVAYPGILAGLALSPLVRGGAPWDGLAGALAGTLVLGGLYLVGRLAYRGGEPLGSGDVTIGGLVGATVGLGALLPALVGGAVLNGLFAAALALRRRSLKSYLPYGPGLCLGALAALLA